MPKVDAKYTEQKREKILNAALTVAMRKPIHEVSMRDIISESGLSQGGIYLYFANIDEVYIALINRESFCHDVKTQIDEIILSGVAPERIISRLFDVWKIIVLDTLMGVGKIYFELCTVYAGDKERLKNFLSKVKVAADEAYLQEQCAVYAAQKINDGYFSPKQPVNDIFAFLVTALSGITRNLILCKHYHIGELFPEADAVNEDNAVRTLCAAFILLLGGNVGLTGGA